MSLDAAAVMNRKVVVVAPDTPALRVAELLIESGTGVLPVCTRDGSLLGMIDEEHLLRPLGAVSALHLVWWLNRNCNELGCGHDCFPHLRLDRTDLWELMNRTVTTAPETLALAEIIKLWARHGGRTLLILRDGKFVGLVGSAEVAAALALLSDGDEDAIRRDGGAGSESRKAA